MKHLQLFTLCLFFCPFAFSQNPPTAEKAINKDKCTCNNIPLKGKVKIVDNFANFKVQIVTSFADIEVKRVTSFPDRCGEWQFVDSFPDFTIQIVESFPDLKVKFVEAFAGMK